MKKTKQQSQKNITAKDVANMAGVSKWTVSRAFTKDSSISESSLKKVLAAAEELGYKPNLLARSLAKNKTNMIAILISELGSPNVLRVFDELSSQLQSHGLISIVLNVHLAKDYKNSLSLAGQLQVDGVIFLGTEVPQEIIDKNIEHIPLLSLYRHCTTEKVHSVSTDGFSAGRHVGNLFIKLGYRRIAYMAGPEKKSTGLMRLEGLTDILNENNIPLEKLFRIKHFTRILAFNIMSQYLRETDPHNLIDAIFCETDIFAIGVIDALRHHNLEGSIAVVGFDDIDLASSPSYNLTTYRQDLKPIVSTAVKLISSSEINNNRILIPGQLILRKSHLKG